MLITPLPGVSRENLLQKLQQIETEVSNLWTGGFNTTLKKLLAYLDWASESAGALSRLVASADVERLVLTGGYERILANTVVLSAPTFEKVTNTILSEELRQRSSVLERAVKSLTEQISRWSKPGAFVVFDSTVYIRHQDKLEDIDFRKTIGLPSQPVHLIVPMVVVDELDRLKETNDKHARWRAGYSLAVLDNRLPDPNTRGILRDRVLPAPGQGVEVRHEVTVEILLDPPGHVRLPNDDEEIVDRALAVEALAGRKVVLVTYDTNQSTRARAAGLEATKLSKPAEEPAAK